jgi:hypothetical protein
MCQSDVITGITFAQDQGKLFVPLREVGELLGIEVHFEKGRVYIGGHAMNRRGPTLPDGTMLILLRDLSTWATVDWDAEKGRAVLRREGQELYVTHGQKRVVVDKAKQKLFAMQGDRVVLTTPISSGARGYRTPTGTFEAGPYKALMHRSSLYDDAPMPYSVQVTGNIFIHGYSSVPDRPASHGCIRVPSDGSAKFFYEWVELGTPIEINGRWPG